MSAPSELQQPPPFRMGGPSGRRPSLLQNMSCRPDATVEHNGRHHCRALRFGFAPAADRPLRLSDLLPVLGLKRRSNEALLQKIERMTQEPCPLLASLPAVAAVHSNAAGESLPGLTDQPLLVLAVLVRCNGGVFMRDRVPAVSEERLLRSVTLLAPLSWNPAS